MSWPSNCKRGSNGVLFSIAFTTIVMTASVGFSAIIFAKKPQGLLKLGLVALWPANGNARDVVGGHNGVLVNGATFSDGVAGSSFDLDNTAGIDDGWTSSVFPPSAFDGGAYIQVHDSSAWAFGNKDFTIELWANFNSIPVNDIGHSQGGVLISSDEGPYDVNKWWFALGGGVLNFHINDPNLGPVWLVQAPFTPELNQWYHLAITRKHNLYTIYVNGVAVGSETNTRTIPNANAPLMIGSAEGYYFNGRLDEIGIYKRALSAAEVNSIFEANAQP